MRARDPKDLKDASRRPGRANHDSLDEGGRAERALVLCPILKTQRSTAETASNAGAALRRSPEARRQEAIGLAAAIGLDVAGSAIVNLSEPRAGTLFGSGKVEEIGAILRTQGVGLVIVDGPVSPVQQRNLEKAWGVKLLDRTGLILEIFGARAHTREGRLQVELAHLTYQKSRLVRSWTHLERQRGGFGFLGGPGETQIEADRRLIQERITQLERLLDKVRRTRELHRESRRRVPYAIVALVGYTNAGKSTLFNRLTQADVRAEDLLFATLDPTLRGLKLPGGRTVILSDTVGFISELPTHLVAAFRATLEEVVSADIIVHVRDIAHEETQEQADDVRDVLRSLGIDPDDGRRLLDVWNKIDLLSEEERAQMVAQAARREGTVALSAMTGQGLDTLLQKIEAQLTAGLSHFSLTLAPQDGARLNWLYEKCDVLARSDEADGAVTLTLRVPAAREDQFRNRFRAELEASARQMSEENA